MNAPFSQAARLGKLHTDLGTDKVVLLRFSGTDHVNDLFEYRVEALSAAQLSGIPTARAGKHRADGPEAHNALTIKSDQPMGAHQTLRT